MTNQKLLHVLFCVCVYVCGLLEHCIMDIPKTSIKFHLFYLNVNFRLFCLSYDFIYFPFEFLLL